MKLPEYPAGQAQTKTPLPRFVQTPSFIPIIGNLLSKCSVVNHYSQGFVSQTSSDVSHVVPKLMGNMNLKNEIISLPVYPGLHMH